MLSEIKCYQKSIKISQEAPLRVRRESEKNFRLKDELPKLVMKYKTLSATDLKRRILQDFNKDITDKAILMHFQRHPEVKAALQTELSI